jgi:hypothetical protein
MPETIEWTSIKFSIGSLHEMIHTLDIHLTILHGIINLWGHNIVQTVIWILSPVRNSTVI